MMNGVYSQQEVMDRGNGNSLKLGRNYHIDLQMLNSVGDILVDGSSIAGGGQTMHYLSGTTDCKFYMAVPGYPAADATVSNFKVTEL